jgi:Tfp pilus assembly protein PilO
MVSTSRIVADRRLLVSVLVVLAVLNLAGLIVVFGPLRARVRTLTQRATAASLAASTAARELTTARQTATGSNKAVTDLERFYTKILPATQPAARQMTFVRLAQLAGDANLSYDHRSFSQEKPERDDTLTRATLTMNVFGTYRDLRQFLYRLESGEDFVVIRDVGLVRGDAATDPLEAALTLSTFYKAPDGQ